MPTVCTGEYISIPPFAAFPIHPDPAKFSRSQKAHTCCPYVSNCCHLFNLPVRTCTRSRVFTPVADVLQKYLCTRINPVFISIDRVHILIDVERKRKGCAKMPH